MLNGGYAFQLDGRELDAIYQIGVPRTYSAGDAIFNAGNKAESVYYIDDGWVRIYRLNPDGRKLTVGGIRNAGEFFGLAEALNGVQCSSFAQAITAVKVIVISRKDFLELLNNHPTLALKIARLLAARMRETEGLVHEITSQQSSGRLAGLLLKLASKYGVSDGEGTVIKLKLTHEEMASMVGVTRQTVTSVLSMFKNERSITMEDDHIKIIDVDKLKAWLSA
ncbi:MAG: Crp/Fnr family transcriptional regulator [Peptococcaceae bacterium]|nr:Crp/Fnr family transcriptional regulator [Peptococcaceae bacterium]